MDGRGHSDSWNDLFPWGREGILQVLLRAIQEVNGTVETTSKTVVSIREKVYKYVFYNSCAIFLMQNISHGVLKCESVMH